VRFSSNVTTPCEECIVDDESVLELLVIVAVVVREPERDREQSRCLRSEIQARSIRAAHDERELMQRGIVDFVFREQRVEAAQRPFVRELDTLDVERHSSRFRSALHDLGRRREQKLGAGIDEAPDEPWTGDTVDLGTFASDPLHVFFSCPDTSGRALRSRKAIDTFSCHMDDSVAIHSQEAQGADGQRRARWLLLVHQIPPKPDYFRVKVRRRLARLGSLPLKSTVYVLPWSPERVEDFQWLRREIIDEGGEALLCEAQLVEGITDAELESQFRKSREADYGAIVADVTTELARFKWRKPAEDERVELEAAVARLWRRLREVVALDFFGAAGRAAAERAIAALTNRTRDGTGASEVKRDRPPAPHGAVWVTRRDVFVDRIASAWLIRTFIDPFAEFLFVSGTAYVPKPGEIRFDMFEAEYTHVGDLCTFEVLLERFGLDRDAALHAVAEIVHDIDVKDGKFARPEASGIEQLLSGIVRGTPTDDARLVAGSAVFASLYESFRDPSSIGDDARATHGAPSTRADVAARER
jgi:hypothetical protein